MQFQRYGIFHTPPPGALARFGARWLGWDVATGQPSPHPDIPDLPAPIADITATPRKYGLHGTIKPPFFLAAGTTAPGLHDAFETLCASLSPVRLDGLRITRLGRFLALTVKGDQSLLAKHAAIVVQRLDPFRAPPTSAELARRRRSRLSPRQEALLAQWGYPYVMKEFRFHITLTGPLSPDQADQVQQVLTPRLAPLLPVPFDVTDLTLVGEDAAGMFHEIHRCALTG